MSFSSYLIVGLGGFFGAMARFGVWQLLSSVSKTFPSGTFICNLGGSLLAGILMGMIHQGIPISPNTKLLFITGFCGAFTTMSAFVLDTHQLWRQGQFQIALLYAAITILASFLLFIASFWSLQALLIKS